MSREWEFWRLNTFEPSEIVFVLFLLGVLAPGTLHFVPLTCLLLDLLLSPLGYFGGWVGGFQPLTSLLLLLLDRICLCQHAFMDYFLDYLHFPKLLLLDRICPHSISLGITSTSQSLVISFLGLFIQPFCRCTRLKDTKRWGRKIFPHSVHFGGGGGFDCIFCLYFPFILLLFADRSCYPELSLFLSFPPKCMKNKQG